MLPGVLGVIESLSSDIMSIQPIFWTSEQDAQYKTSPLNEKKKSL